MNRTLFYNIAASFFNVLLIVVIKLMVDASMITPEIASFFRHVSAFLIISPFLISTLKKSPEHFIQKIPHFAMFVRGLFYAIATFLWPIVYTHIPLHIAMTMGFLVPFISNILLVIFLKEKIPNYVWISMLFGVVGVLIILRPYIHDFNKYHILALVCITFWAASATLNKFIAQKRVKVHIALFYLTIYASIFTSGLVFFAKISIPHNIFLPIACLGFVSVVAQFFVIKSYQTSAGYLVNTMEFVRFLMFLTADVLLFGANLTLMTIVGSVIIGASVYYVLRRYNG